MKTLLTKLVCTFISLTLLLVPAAVLAEEAQTPVEVTVGDNEHSNFLVRISGLDADNLFINGISYDAHLTSGERIVVYKGDLMSAKGAAEVIAQYNANANADSRSSVDPASLIVISKGSAKLIDSALPDLETVARELETMEFPEELRDDSTQRLELALSALEQTLSGSSDQIYSDRITSILQLFSASDARFNKNMTDVYQLLYDIRAAIACGALPKSLLAEETMTNLLTIYRDVLKKGGLDLNEIGFWENDAAWVAYAATKIKPEVNVGERIAIADKTGKTVSVTVKGVWPEPVVPDPPDAYDYEPPMPSGLDQDVPL